MIPPLLPDTHPLLSQVMPEFDFAHVDALAKAAEMAQTLVDGMKLYEGIGLAANQIGFAHRAFAMEIESGPVVCFNPTVTWLANETVKLAEGCLTFAGLELTIARPKECQLRYTDAAGQTQVLDLKGYEARCALHEMDHLDGIVFTGRVSKLKLNMAKKKALKRKK